MEIRLAVPGDELAVADVHVRSWQVAYRGLVDDAFLDGLRPEDRAARYTFGSTGDADPRTYLAVRDVRVLGFASIGPARDDDIESRGELYALYVDPNSWERGVGAALMQRARAGLLERGFAEAILWLIVGNERAHRFYVADGWRDDGVTADDVVGGCPLTIQRMSRRLT